MAELHLVRPIIPDVGDELSWVLARINQVSEILGCAFSNVRVWSTPKTIDKLIALWNTRNLTNNPLIGCEVSFAGHVGIVYDAEGGNEYGWFDDRTVEIDAITENNDLVSFYGLTYPDVISQEHLEIRWVLQMVDGVEGRTAEEIAVNMLNQDL
ncbi:MAG: hypothetical protein ACKOW9_00375 [Candidatus Paceibacterota bacterium]